MARDSGAGAYSNLGMSAQGGVRRGSFHRHDPLMAWHLCCPTLVTIPLVYAAPVRRMRQNPDRANIRSDLQHDEGNRPQRAAEPRDEADRERVGHDDADHRVGEDRGAPDDGADAPDTPESGQSLP